jgi:hypothetical protein
MNKFEVIFAKINRIAVNQPGQPPQLAKQILITDKPDIKIPVPDGYGILTITQLLPELIILSDESTKNKSFNCK